MANPLNATGIEIDPQVKLARRLVARLERLSADSYWAHQACGIRDAGKGSAGTGGEKGCWLMAS